MTRAPERALCPLAIDLFCGLGGWTEGLLAEDARDAARYRWLRDVYGADINSLWERGPALDAAIDAAISAKEGA